MLSIYKIRQFFIIFFLYGFLLQALSAKAVEDIPFSHKIFSMQKYLAGQGNALSQYKLGLFYELGMSVEPNREKALEWYKKALMKGHKAAANRITYLNVKQQGYNAFDHSDWVNRIKHESLTGNIHSTIILGQLFHHGLGLKQDYNKALKYFKIATAKGYFEINYEMDEVLSSLNKSNKKIIVDKPLKKSPMKVVTKKSKVPKKINNVVKNKRIVKLPLKATQEAKRRKYENAMREHYKEQLILQEQQNWTEDEDEDSELLDSTEDDIASDVKQSPIKNKQNKRLEYVRALREQSQEDLILQEQQGWSEDKVKGLSDASEE